MNATPNFAAIVAVTIDGKIALDSHHFSDWTSKEDKDFLKAELDGSDAVVVGRNTFETAKERLLKRNSIVFTRSVTKPVEQFPHVWFINPAHTQIADFCASHNFEKVAVLGGAQVYSYFTKHDLIDNWYITIEPIIFGTGIPLLEGEAFPPRKYRFIETKQLNPEGTTLLHYKKFI